MKLTFWVVYLKYYDKIEEIYTSNSGNRDKRLPGELGQGVIVNGSVADKETEKIGYKRHAFNQLVSDRISLFRTLQDYRNQK